MSIKCKRKVLYDLGHKRNAAAAAEVVPIKRITYKKPHGRPHGSLMAAGLGALSYIIL